MEMWNVLSVECHTLFWVMFSQNVITLPSVCWHGCDGAQERQDGQHWGDGVEEAAGARLVTAPSLRGRHERHYRGQDSA